MHLHIYIYVFRRIIYKNISTAYIHLHSFIYAILNTKNYITVFTYTQINLTIHLFTYYIHIFRQIYQLNTYITLRMQSYTYLRAYAHIYTFIHRCTHMRNLNILS